jgi:hypothetical protein
MADRYSTSVSYQQQLKDDQSPDIIYLNADIINNNTGYANYSQLSDPQIRFNENRDTPILKDSSLYNFSIVRFSMNGAGKDLPLFIPTILTNGNNLGADGVSPDINLTAYSTTLCANLTQNNGSGVATTISVYSPETFVKFIPETQNQFLAPVPTVPPYPSAPAWSSTTTYLQNQQVAYLGNQWTSTFGTSLVPNVGNTPPSTSTGTSPSWNYVAYGGIADQDVSTRYYWVYTYTWWVQLVNNTFATANTALQTAFQTLWTAPVGTPITVNGVQYSGGWGRTGTAPTLTAVPPKMFFNPTTNLFSIYYDSTAYGMDSLGTPINSGSATQFYQLFFNPNMYGLFANFANRFWATIPQPKGLSGQVSGGWGSKGIITPSTTTIGALANELLVYNYLGQNVLTTTTPTYVVMTQDYGSDSTLWSPVASIVFTTTLLPVANEQQTVPVQYGASNTTARTTPSAFAPIITDISLALNNASDWRGFIEYNPTAEYRITAFQNGMNEIRQVDIAVFWKNRLDGKLYPLQMFNLSSVSMKLMFRKKDWNNKSV